ncbi:hypothetical protein [Chromatocurvus halotolerans]|uniref:hypothetical protein n=1 Tax=Chromatocurvus halotolerans TaxID=1132028 RepID=UPI0010503403|nr:hypothetical protein [Chromatocurvus halotolerans]
MNDDERPHLPLRVEPRQFAHWASKYVPDLLHADFLSHTESLVDSNLIAEDEGRKPDSRQEAKYRCRGLAAYFWSLEPKVNIREMADRDELRRFGCPEMDTTHSQRRRWIKNLAPSNKPGRPRKRES